MLIKYEEELQMFLISREVPEYIYAKYYLKEVIIITYYLIMSERTMYLAITMLLVQHRFQNHWSDGEHNAKTQTEN